MAWNSNTTNSVIPLATLCMGTVLSVIIRSNDGCMENTTADGHVGEVVTETGCTLLES